MSENYKNDGVGEHAEEAKRQLGQFFNSQFCGYCGCNLGRVEAIAVCDSCDLNSEQERRDAANKEQAIKEQAKQSQWAKIAGIYSTADTIQLPHARMRDIHDKWNPETRWGVTIAGTGPGKSWLLWLLLKKAWLIGRPFEYRDATEVRSELVAIGRHGEHAPIIRKLIKTPLLAIDNFGLNKSTEAADELWHQVIEGRIKAQRPTLVASPYGGGGLEKRFVDGTMGASIVKRLGVKSNWVLNTSTWELTPPTL